MITTSPVPAGQCRKCKHCVMTLRNPAPKNTWIQQCKTVEDIEPDNDMTEELAIRLENALIRLAKHHDCPDLASNE